MSSSLRKRAAATSKQDEEPEIILDATEQEKVVQDLMEQAEAAQARWTPVVAGLCLVAALVPMLLPVPEGVSGLLLRLLTMPPLIYSSFTLLRPSSFPPELASLPADLVLLPPVLAALLVWYTNGDLLSQRTWGWTVPAAVVGLKREVEGGLKQGVESAARMRELVYSSPTA